MARLTLKNLNKSYPNGYQAVKNFSLEKAISLLNLLELDMSEFFEEVQREYTEQEVIRIEDRLSDFPEFTELLFAIQDFDEDQLLDLIDYVDHLED